MKVSKAGQMKTFARLRETAGENRAKAAEREKKRISIARQQGEFRRTAGNLPVGFLEYSEGEKCET